MGICLLKRAKNATVASRADATILVAIRLRVSCMSTLLAPLASVVIQR